MPRLLIKIAPPVIFWGIFAFTILQIPYPDSLTQANIIQLISFFTPLLLAFIFTIEIFLKNVFMSFSVSLGLTFLLILKSLDSLNLVTVTLVIVSVGLLVSYFRKNRTGSLTKFPKISKLTHLQKRVKN